MERRGLGAGVALLFCPCHLALYGFLLLTLGISASIIVNWLAPLLAVLFIGGIVLMILPSHRDMAVCCVSGRPEPEAAL
jgi:hypothetical protein